jgi:lipopolysaccharide export system protein LptA
MPAPRFASTRSAGLLIAGAVALVLAGGVLLVALTYRPPPPRPAPLGDVTDINAAPVPDAPADGAIVPGRDGRWQFTRKDDPGRLQAEVLYRRMNPVGPGAYELTEPRAWIYLDDGRALFVRADGGRLKGQASAQQIESGVFEGRVVILLFPPRSAADAGRPRDAMSDAPALVARTNAVRFDTLLLEFATDDPFEIESPIVHFEGTGLIVRGNQALERIEYLNVARDGLIRYHVEQREEDRRRDEGWESVAQRDAPGDESGRTPARAARTKPAKETVARNSRPAADDEPAQPSDAPPATATRTAGRAKEDLYRAVFSGDVRVSQKRRLLTADSLLVWLRTLDNKLPEGAFGGATAAAGEPAAEVALRAPAPAASGHAGAGEWPLAAVVPALALGSRDWPPRLFAPGPADLELTWTGTLTARPIAGQTPPELAEGNHLALRFTAAAPGGAERVSMLDAEIEARGGCAELEYLATRRVLTMHGGGQRVWLAAPESGCLVGPSVRVDLSTGEATIPGEGQLATIAERWRIIAMAPGDDGLPAFLAGDSGGAHAWLSRRVFWQSGADFQFRVADGQIRDALEWAEFNGRAVAMDERSSLGGDTIRVEFVEHGRTPMLLSHLRVTGDVEALAEGWSRPPGVDIALVGPDLGEGVLRAEALDVRFEPSTVRAGEADPVYLLARGDAAAGRRDAAVFAPVLEAHLSRDDRGDIVVTDFEARAAASGGEDQSPVRFRRADGVRAAAERIRGHAQRQTATLTGRRVEVARGESVITSTSVDFDGLKGTMAVLEPGRFDHVQPAPGGGETRIAATWTRSMLFDDAARTLDCAGDTVVTRDEPLAADVVRGQRVRIEFAGPDAGTTAAAEPSGAPGASVEGLRVLRATVYGDLEDPASGDAPPAKIESRRYRPASAAAGAGRILETITYIESDVLTADDERGTFSAPTGGRAIVYDQREPSAAPSGDSLSSPRGTSSFRWAQSMLFTRDTGVLDLEREVEVVHKPVGDGPVARMTADRLTATVDLAGGGSRLVDAHARGAVYAESGPQRLVGEDVRYDVRAGVLVAQAAPGGTVTLFDDRRASPFTARKLRWDLLRDQVEILEPATIIAPR